MKKLFIVYISLFFISCEKEDDFGITTSSSTSSLGPCTLNCDMWEKCSTRQINSNDWWGPREWFCENVFVKYYQTGIFYSTQTIIDDNGVSVESNKNINVGYPSENNLKMTIGSVGNSYEIQISFIDSESGVFNVLHQSVYIPELNANVFCEGNGSFVKNGSSPYYTLELNLGFEVQDTGFNYDVYLIGSNG
jgi:hypothetical protein